MLPFQHWRRKHRQQQNRNQQQQQQRRGQMFPFQIFSAAAAETKNQMIILILVKKHKKLLVSSTTTKIPEKKSVVCSAACFETRPRFSDLPLKSQIASCLNRKKWPKHFKQVFSWLNSVNLQKNVFFYQSCKKLINFVDILATLGRCQRNLFWNKEAWLWWEINLSKYVTAPVIKLSLILTLSDLSFSLKDVLIAKNT